MAYLHPRYVTYSTASTSLYVRLSDIPVGLVIEKDKEMTVVEDKKFFNDELFEVK